MKRIFILVLVILLTACGPSEAQIQKAIEQTQAASPTQTATVVPNTSTPRLSTATPKATPTDENELVRRELFANIEEFLNQQTFINKVGGVSADNSTIEIDVTVTSNEKVKQLHENFNMALSFSIVFTKFSEAECEALAMGKPFNLVIITHSKGEEYTVVSSTDYEMLTKLKAGVENIENMVSFDEWAEVAQPRFK